MVTFTAEKIRARAQATTTVVRKSAKAILEEAAASGPEVFDVFLSYSSQETDETVLGVKNTLGDHGLSVYVDKINDPSMKPEDVSRDTAETLRKRLRQSKSLLYLHSDSSNVSKWMPWELGYFDGFRSKVGIFPITKNANQNYSGQEYLGIYPYVGHAIGSQSNRERLVIFEGRDRYAIYEEWVTGTASIQDH